VRNVLLDAGALIALFACDDKHHAHFDELVTTLSAGGLRLSTTCPCVVEASYLLDAPQRFEMLRWIELGGALVYSFDPHHLGNIIEWMQRYTEPGKRDMDLADASLYWLAVETGTTEIMTVDIADFTRYRLPDKRFFSIL
jgi:predicted nucleic acid-binding protein